MNYWDPEPQYIYDEGVARSCKALLESQKRDGPPSQEKEGSDNVWMHYPHPLVDIDGVPWEFDNADLPRALVELKMCAVSNEIREKERWWEKMHDETIRAKWREEIRLHEEVEENRFWKLSPKMIDYVFQELEGYAVIRDPDTDIQLACFERVWRSDELIPESLRQDLLSSSALLEASSPPDWHPGSDGKVLDLVHPSLYPIVYGRTHAWHPSDGQFKPLQPPKPLPGSSGTHLSKQFCWLPSDFFIAADGTATLVSPYINNVDAQMHPSLNGIITSLVQAAVPPWDRVLASLVTPLSPYRMKQEGRSTFRGDTPNYPRVAYSIRCLWRGGTVPYPLGDPTLPLVERVLMSDPEYDRDPEKWLKMQTDEMELADALDAYEGELEAAVKKSVETMEECKLSLKGKTIQVIVKLANIVLTPEKPEYGGGTWHVEGMENEHVVSTFIYYYDEDNISKSALSFRASTNQPLYHDQNDHLCMQTLYGLDRDDACIQERGSVPTKQHRCIAFPNLYQHRVSPFDLINRTKPGHRKIVVLFLVDPTIYIPSATQIPPQQEHLYKREIVEKNEVFTQKMPMELREKVVRCLDEGMMSREEAEEVRRKFMEERSVDAGKYESGDHSFFGITFNLCEH